MIAQVYDSHYRLSASIWTNDLRRAHRVANEEEAGIIWVNTWFFKRFTYSVWWDMKQIGIGREGGMHSYEFYSELKNICIKL
ncbi:hypothetical protein CJ195_05215 [Bacillus sp. UMB0899]|nr:hypothetical protein CJ195_05215 [Bacillus sp. UMB0899]